MAFKGLYHEEIGNVKTLLANAYSIILEARLSRIIADESAGAAQKKKRVNEEFDRCKKFSLELSKRIRLLVLPGITKEAESLLLERY